MKTLRASSTFSHTRTHTLTLTNSLCACVHFKATLLIEQKTKPRNTIIAISRFKWTLQCSSVLLVISHKNIILSVHIIKNTHWQFLLRPDSDIGRCTRVKHWCVILWYFKAHARLRFFSCTQTRSDTRRSPEFVLIPTTDTRRIKRVTRDSSLRFKHRHHLLNMPVSFMEHERDDLCTKSQVFKENNQI